MTDYWASTAMDGRTELQRAVCELEQAYDALQVALDNAEKDTRRMFAPIIRTRQLAYARAQINAAAEPNCS